MMGLYFKRKYLVSRKRRLWPGKAPMGQMSVPCQLPPQPSDSGIHYSCVTTSSLCIVPQNFKIQNHRMDGQGTDVFHMRGEGSCRLDNFGLATQQGIRKGRSYAQGIRKGSWPTLPQSQFLQCINCGGSGHHYSFSCIFQAQWTHICTKKVRSESHFRTVKRLMLDPLSSNFFS